jgi:hypothetical protein
LLMLAGGNWLFCPIAVIEGSAQRGCPTAGWLGLDDERANLFSWDASFECGVDTVVVWLSPRSRITQSPAGAPRRRRHHVASTRRDDH